MDSQRRVESPYKHIFREIPDVYKISIKDVAQTLKMPFDEETYFLDFSVINDFSPEELNELLFSVLSWLEHINYKKTLIDGVLAIKNNEKESMYANLFMQTKTSLSSAKKVTNTEVEKLVELNEEYRSLKRKIDLYKAYLNYLSGLYEILEMLHYSIKHKISLNVSNEKKIF